MPPRTVHRLSSRYRSQSVARVPESHTSTAKVLFRLAATFTESHHRSSTVGVD
jgi:hypothetical protein